MTPDRAKLLIVDDSRMIRKVIRSLMQGLGFNSIDEAPDGASALDLFRMGNYDLVIADWNMPRISGIQLLRTIRHGQERCETAVLLISGDVSAQRMVEAVDSGANGFVAKPFAASALCAQVLRIVSELPPATGLRAAGVADAAAGARRPLILSTVSIPPWIAVPPASPKPGEFYALLVNATPRTTLIRRRY